MSRVKGILTGLLVSLTFTALATRNLEGQGVYYDELHQAPGAFAYVGRHPSMFTIPPGGPPVLNMSYSGAVKSAMYGMYLRVTGFPFTVRSWRLIGILSVAVGILVFCAWSAPYWPPVGLGVFALFLLSDSSVLLMTRHDWGPVALALCLRFSLLAVWLSIAVGSPRRWKFVTAGVLVGFAVFEKLSSVVLFVPLLALLATTAWRSWRSWFLTCCGLIAGSAPLIVANLVGFRWIGTWISLSAVGQPVPPDPTGLLAYAVNYASLGDGSVPREFILGEVRWLTGVYLDAVLVFTAMACICVAAAWKGRRNRILLVAASMSVSYVVIGVVVRSLPIATWIHHWVIGTPLQYAAIGLAASAFLSDDLGRTRAEKSLRAIGLLAFGGIAVLHLNGMASSLTAMTSGRTSAAFAPAFNQLGRVVSQAPQTSAFIATDWGSGTQMYAFGNGRDDLVHEPFMSANPAEEVGRILADGRLQSVYAVTTHLRGDQHGASEDVLHALETALAWEERPVDERLQHLDPIFVRVFIRAR